MRDTVWKLAGVPNIIERTTLTMNLDEKKFGFVTTRKTLVMLTTGLFPVRLVFLVNG